VVVAGGPRSGKTTLTETLAERTRRQAFKSDDLIGLGWSEASEAASAWFDAPDPWICEGVAMPRALRKWLAANDGAPSDLAIWLNGEVEHRVPGQRAMTKGCETVWLEILPELERRGVEILAI